MGYNNTSATTSVVQARQRFASGDGGSIEPINISDSQTQHSLQPLNVAEAVVRMLENLGIESAHGVAGGAMAALWGALSNSKIQVLNYRHETGAAFAAAEAYFASDCPTVTFTTAGPGITNALTGLLAARGEGAKVILLSACTSAPQRGRWAIQETSTYTIPNDGIFTSGTLFNYAITIESPAQLPQIFRRIALGLAQPGGFVAHLSIPTAVQNSPVDSVVIPQIGMHSNSMGVSEDVITQTIALLSEGPFAIWLGFGARNASAEIFELAQRTGAAVMCSPRAKGIFPENHSQFIGVTGLGGHGSVMTYMQEQTPLRTLVLGTRLGEPTSFWNPVMIPPGGFIHVDSDPEVPGVSYPNAQTFPIQSDIKTFVQALLLRLPTDFPSAPTLTLPNPELDEIKEATVPLVRPEVLMEAIQKVIVEGSDAIVMAESGNSFTWSTHCLRIPEANRYRVSTGVGAMGHVATGVVGAAFARQTKAVAIVGDGSMLMNNEINTAVKYGIPAVWIILNDARYNMCHQGLQMLGMTGPDAIMPETDFVMVARGMGADGVRVEEESDLESALEIAMKSSEPFVVDVMIDPSRKAPSKGRNQGLASLGIKSAPSKAQSAQISFPNI